MNASISLQTCPIHYEIVSQYWQGRGYSCHIVKVMKWVKQTPDKDMPLGYYLGDTLYYSRYSELASCSTLLGYV